MALSFALTSGSAAAVRAGATRPSHVHAGATRPGHLLGHLRAGATLPGHLAAVFAGRREATMVHGLSLLSLMAPSKFLLAVFTCATRAGHLAAALAGRGFGGVRLGLAPSKLPQTMKAFCTKTDSLEGPEEVDVVQFLEEMKKEYPIRTVTVTLKDDELMVLENLNQLGVKSYKLLKAVGGRLSPAAGTPLYQDLCAIGRGFLGVATCAGGPMGLASILVSDLDKLRRLVSSECGVPLPATVVIDHRANVPEENTPANEIVDVVDHVYETVKADVMAMSASYVIALSSAE
ncbi:hypothetical protein ACP70R_038144 [Stipagrostis hirtigluma subsp. patula]